MTTKRIIELLEIERECMLRGALNKCDRDCANCDLVQDDKELNEMYIDVIWLMKQQEPHVIRFNEIDNYETLFLEVKDVDAEDGLAPWVKTKHGLWFSPLDCGEAIKEMRLIDEDQYNVIARCWNKRPSDEQRANVPWKEMEK